MSESNFDKLELQNVLPKLNWVNLASPVKEVEGYILFYELDFQKQLKTLKYHIGYFESGGEKIAAQLYIQEKAHGTVLICHGYYDHAGIYGKLIRSLIEDRYNVVIYDLPGHGLSTGSEVSIQSFDEYQVILDECLHCMDGVFPQPWFAVGQSTGSAILMHHALHKVDQTPFQKQVLFAPLVRPAHWRKNELAYLLVSPFRKYIKRKFVNNSHDDGFLEFLQNKDVLQSKKLSSHWVGSLKKWIEWFEGAGLQSSLPTLVIQGQEDETVDWKHNIPVIQSRFSNVETLYVQEGRHHLVNESVEHRSVIFNKMLSKLREN